MTISTETPNEPRSARIAIRTTPTVKRVLQQAAQASHKRLSEFLLDNGLMAATGALTDRWLFLLNDARWQEFVAALERPTTNRPALQRLMTEPAQLA